ncbi:cation diffusion facilitator family transporter [Caldisphaera lagunensis DSM 15908]|uniref:Cation diffusion facilitator family transporter n=1 Tax=Caldisphaera lagunensis (strain DSM 15908 / JCM 11604 / ANMR 0165 / IC-154) TaxID=1056495 RepID=L0AAI2_CALLD|nr:cation diffusion facilitator family transporter [Caldisphaera lagunensis]AFZ70439.1 cation diffusion facilitator family transporter [Caldisphaera lagunensis DSM 15908]
MVNFSEGKKRSLIASFMYMILSLFKISLGYKFSSLVIVADGIHNIADILTGFAVYIGLFFAEKYPSEKFPFGLYKAENLASLFIAFAIAYAGYEIIMEFLFSKQGKIFMPFLLITIELISAIVTYWLTRYLISTPGIKLDAINAEGVHAFQDALTSIAVIIGVLGEWFSIKYLPLIIGIGIGVYILYQSYQIGRDSILTLLDMGDEKMMENIKNIVSNIEGVIGVHEIKVRKAGPFYFASMHLEAPPALSVKDADKLADIVEEKLRRALPSLLYVSIHVEPGSYTGKWKLALLEDENDSLADEISKVKKIKILDTQNKNIESIINDINLKQGNMSIISSMLKEKGVNAIIYAGKEKLLSLKAYGIEVYHTSEKDEKKVIDLFKEGKLNAD